MTATPFVDGWTVRALDQGESIDVRLPHDAMISEPRAADNPSGYHGSYFPGGRYRYEKRWTPEASPRTALLFEGVVGDTRIRLNGNELAHVQSPYREFVVELDSALTAGENHLEVDVDDSELPHSRWYTGSGIYRPVWQITSATTHFAHDGVGIRTLAVGESSARLEVQTRFEGQVPSAAVVQFILRDGSTTVADHTGSTGSFALELPDARLWSSEDPHLYDAEVRLLVEGQELDRVALRTGLRTIEVDAARGLRINGESVKLRGACVHHDSGLLGAATFRAAEFRRARILKANGYNAVRSAHNPLSRDLLDACDEVGLYVLDELTDVWFAPKTPHDHVERFESLWPDDVRAMVAKDRNHPSVIMYSTGNEIAEIGLPKGVETSRRITEAIRSLDPDRPTTVAVNFLLSVLASRGKSMFQTEEKSKASEPKKPSAITSTVANVISNKIGSISQLVSRLPAADAATREALATVDVAGYNYAWSRYRGDAKRHPDRVVLGTESMPGDLPRIWERVVSQPNLIGDFVWTGWDHLGEAGLGTWGYGTEPAPLTKPYPQLTSGCGTIDITGHPGAETLLARAVWGQLGAPAIAVRPLDRAGQKTIRTAWRFTDAVESWAWRGREGTPAQVEVYAESGTDHVELLVNGRSRGRRRVVDNVAKFRVAYEAGTLTALGLRNGREIGRSELRSSVDPTLTLVPEADAVIADGRDLCFVRIEIRDAAGVVEMLADDEVRLELSGPAELAGYGSGAPATEESFVDPVHRTFYGRALAILRTTGVPGTITLTARSSTGEHTISIEATPAGDQAR